MTGGEILLSEQRIERDDVEGCHRFSEYQNNEIICTFMARAMPVGRACVSFNKPARRFIRTATA